MSERYPVYSPDGVKNHWVGGGGAGMEGANSFSRTTGFQHRGCKEPPMGHGH